MIREITFDQDPPPLEWHIARTPDEFDLLTVSNTSARQLLQFSKCLNDTTASAQNTLKF